MLPKACIANKNKNTNYRHTILLYKTGFTGKKTDKSPVFYSTVKHRRYSLITQGNTSLPEKNARAFNLLALNRRENDEKLDCPPNMRAALDANFPPTIQASATLAIFQFHRQKHLA